MVKRHKTKQKNILIGLGIIVIAISGIYAYYQHNLVYPNTDDAYVNASLMNINSKLEGFIQKIYVKNNQFVHKGDLLIEIDPIEYDIALNQAENSLKANLAQSKIAQENIQVSKASLLKAQSNFDFNSKMAQRYTELYKSKTGTLQDMQRYVNAQNQSLAELKQAQMNLLQASNQYRASLATQDVTNSQIANAKTRRGYTAIRASVDGFITNLNLTQGQLVLPGENLFGFVDDSSWWVDANFKETQIARIKPGQNVAVELDMYDHKYHGMVDSISRASGNTFSILPAQNATGNWVKVTQRFTVRILLKDSIKYPLRVGASAEVIVDTAK